MQRGAGDPSCHTPRLLPCERPYMRGREDTVRQCASWTQFTQPERRRITLTIQLPPLPTHMVSFLRPCGSLSNHFHIHRLAPPPLLHITTSTAPPLRLPAELGDPLPALAAYVPVPLFPAPAGATGQAAHGRSAGRLALRLRRRGATLCSSPQCPALAGPYGDGDCRPPARGAGAARRPMGLCIPPLAAPALSPMGSTPCPVRRQSLARPFL